jgi:hypothetical protein
MTAAPRLAGSIAAAHRCARPWTRFLPSIALATIALVLASPAFAQPTTTPSPSVPAQPATLPVTLTIDPFASGAAVPQRFLGLSFEMAALDQLAPYANRGNLVTLLRSLGPGLLRFGGITADENVAFTDASVPRPAWASSTFGPEQLHDLGVLARRSGWQVLLTVGLAHDEPAAAAAEVATAHSALGPYLAAVEIGNEPDAYGNHGFRSLPWIAQGYEEEVSEYRAAIASLTPNVPIAGPDVSGSGVFPEWGEEEALSQQPVLLTGHHYPLGCAQTPPPSIESLLSAATRGRAAQSLETYMHVASTYRIPMRIDETNTVSCGGVPGISDTFASALWATGYITQAMTAGTAGINLQGNPTNCAGYTPLCTPDPAAVTAGALRAQPEWYALLLSRSLVGCRPLPTTVTTATSTPTTGAPVTGAPVTGAPAPTPVASAATPNLVDASFSCPGHSLRVVLVDDEPPGSSPLALTLNVGTGLGSARITRLTAPAPSATSDVLLAGSAVAANGSWSGSVPTQTEHLATHAGTLALELGPSSAVLVTVTPPSARRSASSRHRHRAVGRHG